MAEKVMIKKFPPDYIYSYKANLRVRSIPSYLGLESDCCWGIRSGPVVTLPGSQGFNSLLDPQAGWLGRYINVWHCGGLS